MDKLDDIFNFLKENKKIISIIFSFIGFMGLLFTILPIYSETIRAGSAFDKWEEQLPENHWLNKENKFYVSPLKQVFLCNRVSVGLIKIDTEFVIYKMGEIGDIIRYAANNNNEKYVLKDSNDKIVKKIRIKLKEDKDINFYRNEERLSFVLSKNDIFKDAFSEKILQVDGFPNNYVLAYMDDTSIAKIQENKIYGLETGKTNLNLNIGENIFVYEIEVK